MELVWAEMQASLHRNPVYVCVISLARFKIRADSMHVCARVCARVLLEQSHSLTTAVLIVIGSLIRVAQSSGLTITPEDM